MKDYFQNSSHEHGHSFAFECSEILFERDITNSKSFKLLNSKTVTFGQLKAYEPHCAPFIYAKIYIYLSLLFYL